MWSTAKDGQRTPKCLHTSDVLSRPDARRLRSGGVEQSAAAKKCLLPSTPASKFVTPEETILQAPAKASTGTCSGPASVISYQACRQTPGGMFNGTVSSGERPFGPLRTVAHFALPRCRTGAYAREVAGSRVSDQWQEPAGILILLNLWPAGRHTAVKDVNNWSLGHRCVTRHSRLAQTFSPMWPRPSIGRGKIWRVALPWPG